MRVAIVYNPIEPELPDQHWLRRSQGATANPTLIDESESALSHEVELIVKALTEAGYESLAFSADSAEALCCFVERERPDVIFNCCEGFRGNSALEMNIAALFELFGACYTGSPSIVLGMARNKGMTKAILNAHGIPTPDYWVIEDPAQFDKADDFPYPLIVKPLCEDASIGIDRYSIVKDRGALIDRIRFILDEFGQPALVEEYIDGREFTVAVLGNPGYGFTMLPVLEVVFEGLPEGIPAILSYESKWVKESAQYRSAGARCLADEYALIEASARELALKSVRALGVCDYSRVDLRMSAQNGGLYVIDINPNPHLSDETGFLHATRAGGRTDTSIILEIVQRCIERTKRMETRDECDTSSTPEELHVGP